MIKKQALKSVVGIIFLILIVSSVNAAFCGGETTCNCGDIVNESYTMNSNLGPCETHGLGVNSWDAGNIILDCAGYEIRGDGVGANNYGVYSLNNYAHNTTIKNCVIKNFSYNVYFTGSWSGNPLTNNKIINNMLLNAYDRGAIWIEYGKNYTIANNTVLSSYEMGIELSSVNESVVENNRVEGTQYWAGISIEFSSYNIIRNNELYNNYAGMGVAYSSDKNNITNNIFDSNGPYCAIWNSVAGQNNIWKNEFINNSCNDAGALGVEQVFIEDTTNLFYINQIGNYWGYSGLPYFNCSRDVYFTSGVCEDYVNDLYAYGQKKGWDLQNTFDGTDFANLPANTGRDYSNLYNVSLVRGLTNLFFLEGIDFSYGVDLDDYIVLGEGFVSIDAQGLINQGNDFNKSANVSFKVNTCDELMIYYCDMFKPSLEGIIECLGGNGGNCESLGICTDVKCSDNIVTMTISHFDSVAGQGEVIIPEFSTITLMLAMVIVIGGFFKIRKREE